MAYDDASCYNLKRAGKVHGIAIDGPVELPDARRQGGDDTMSTQMESPSRTQKATATLRDFRVRGLDAMSALAELNRRVVGGFIELSSAAALEGVRAWSELQSVAMDVARPAPPAKPELHEAAPGEEPPAPDALAWYRRGVESTVSAAQRALKLLEKNGEILARTAEHNQASAERTAKEIREALDVYAERMRKIYSRN
jgi:hypothetical protein